MVTLLSEDYYCHCLAFFLFFVGSAAVKVDSYYSSDWSSDESPCRLLTGLRLLIEYVSYM